MQNRISVTWHNEKFEVRGSADTFGNAVELACTGAPRECDWVRIKDRNLILYRGTLENLRKQFPRTTANV